MAMVQIIALEAVSHLYIWVAKATVTPDGLPAAFFMRVKVK